MRRFAFFLSCEEYTSYSDTPYCHSDAMLLRNTLLEQCDYLPENCKVLKLNKGDGIRPEHIIKEVESLIDRSDDQDSILFFYAGHGTAIDKKTYLILPDTIPHNELNTAVRVSDIAHYLSKNNRLNIRIFDCCHSGEGSRNAISELANDDFMKAILSDGTDCTLTFASCAVHQKSYWDESRKNGIFTAALVDAIISAKPETEVYLERIKIEVCAAVQDWCGERGKIQTPTLSVQISGNLPIAKRLSLPLTGNTSIAEFFPPLSLAERLRNARLISVVNKETLPSLKNATQAIEHLFFEHYNSDEFFGVHLSRKSLVSAEYIPNFLKEKIIDRMKSYNTKHTMEVERFERPRLKSYNLLVQYEPVYETNYHISQHADMPDSFITFESATDGYLPSSCVFFYICPLQASVAIISGVYFDKSYGESESYFRIAKMQHQIFSIEDIAIGKYKALVQQVLGIYKEFLTTVITGRLSYLEKEVEAIR